MYKLLLCWRYLRTRYIALASIVSVTLGVATMIVVNSVMQGFTVEMRDKIHGILSDLEFRSHSMSGFADPDGVMHRIREVAGNDIQCMTPTVQVPAMLSYQYGGQTVTRQVHIVGIDPKTQSDTSDFGKYLTHPANRQEFSFALHENGWLPTTPEDIEEGREGTRPELAMGGEKYRRTKAANHRRYRESVQPLPEAPVDQPDQGETASELDAANQVLNPSEVPVAAEGNAAPVNPFASRQEPEAVFDPEHDQHTGIVLGIALSNFRSEDKQEHFLILPGDDVQLTFPTAGTPPKAVDDLFTIVDFYESKMSEYDSNLVFVPIRKLQELRGMIDPTSGITYVSSIQIKLKPGVDGNVVANKIRRIFPAELFACSTWQEKQGPLLAAVQMETAILNLLLFMIIAVAGFGILAIFFMIVVEKTRDIGVLKSLGASGRGIMGIFLTYGLSLGIVGSGAGMVLGLLFVAYINEIADFLSWCTGHEVFDPTIYYFYKIPTIVQPFTVGWVVAGAMLIAVLASILPARRAARLHPVEALRYE